MLNTVRGFIYNNMVNKINLSNQINTHLILEWVS